VWYWFGLALLLTGPQTAAHAARDARVKLWLELPALKLVLKEGRTLAYEAAEGGPPGSRPAGARAAPAAIAYPPPELAVRSGPGWLIIELGAFNSEMFLELRTPADGQPGRMCADDGP
jgi:hypothetical protein